MDIVADLAPGSEIQADDDRHASGLAIVRIAVLPFGQESPPMTWRRLSAASACNLRMSAKDPVRL